MVTAFHIWWGEVAYYVKDEDIFVNWTTRSPVNIKYCSFCVVIYMWQDVMKHVFNNWRNSLGFCSVCKHGKGLVNLSPRLDFIAWRPCQNRPTAIQVWFERLRFLPEKREVFGELLVPVWNGFQRTSSTQRSLLYLDVLFYGRRKNILKIAIFPPTIYAGFPFPFTLRMIE